MYQSRVCLLRTEKPALADQQDLPLAHEPQKKILQQRVYTGFSSWLFCFPEKQGTD
jgi:hypothetical protein